MCLHWRHAKGLSISGGADKLHGFELAGADGVYHPAEAHIDGETVVVTSAAVPAPRTVRYAWADNPQANLENAAGLPAAPFRTDTFPVSMNTSPSVTAPAWEKSTWQGEPAWASIHGPVRAIVSEARARLIYLGAADGSYNLLNAPTPRPAEGQNQGGHRFWLGPQYRWVWPPLKEWEFSAAAQVSTRADGRRSLNHRAAGAEPPTTHPSPTLFQQTACAIPGAWASSPHRVTTCLSQTPHADPSGPSA